jgi:hypothetical protein
MSDLKRNLVESADAAARVGVLFVAVGIFAAMWESDSPTTNDDSNWLARRARPAQVVARAGEDSTSAHGSQSSHAGRSNGLRAASMQSISSMRSISAPQYPMPAGIVPGNYRVVDSLGKVQPLQVTAEMASGTDPQHPLDQYILEDGDRTIYFIRIRRGVGTSGSAIAGSHVDSLRR